MAQILVLLIALLSAVTSTVTPTVTSATLTLAVAPTISLAGPLPSGSDTKCMSFLKRHTFLAINKKFKTKN